MSPFGSVDGMSCGLHFGSEKMSSLLNVSHSDMKIR